METHSRSVVKAVSWRVFATCITGLITYLFTEDLWIALGVGSSEALAKIFFYWGHERLWDRISWGRVPPIVFP